MKKRLSLILVGLLVLGLLAGCGNTAPADTEEPAQEPAATAENMQADVAIIGAGGAGMAAALTAADNGAKVILVEKMPMVGGNTTLATGGINAAGTTYQEEAGVEDSVDVFYEDTMKGGHELNNPELVRTLVDNAKDGVDWLVSIGADLSDVGLGGGATNKRFHRPTGGAPVGAEIVRVLRENVEANENITLLLKTEVTEILTEDGAVTGLKAKGEEGEFTIEAPAVVVASGGFSANQDMVIQYVPELKGFATTNAPGATGEGVVMAQAVGADVVDMDQIQTHPTVVPEKGTMITEAVRGNGAILVNREGNRFVNEMETRDVVSAAVLDQEGGTAFLVFDDQVRESLKAIEGYIEKGLVTEGTAEEVAEALGMNTENFVASIEKFNEGVAAGDEFGRENLEITFDPAGTFYAIEITPAVHHTMGGLKINTDAQVISVDGEAIPGLFAAGECTGGVHGGNRLGGNALADIIVFGRIAGQGAANLEK